MPGDLDSLCPHRVAGGGLPGLACDECADALADALTDAVAAVTPGTYTRGERSGRDARRVSP